MCFNVKFYVSALVGVIIKVTVLKIFISNFTCVSMIQIYGIRT